MDTYIRKKIDIVSYVHKKFGSIEIKSESNKTKIEILDESNPPKRVKVEALKYGSQIRYGLFGNSYTRPTYIKTPHYFQWIGSPNAYQQICHQWSKLPSLWSKTQQPNVKLNMKQLKIPRVTAPFPKCFPTFNSNNNADERSSEINFKPKCAYHKMGYPVLVNTIPTTAASNCMFFSKPNQNQTDSTAHAKQTPNKKNYNKETKLKMLRGVLKAQVIPTTLSAYKGKPNSLLQTVQGLNCKPHNKLLSAQSTLKSCIPQGFLKAHVSASLVGAFKGMPNSLLQRVQGLSCNTQHKLHSAQPALKSHKPQGFGKAQVKSASVYAFIGKPYSLLQTVQAVNANPQYKLLSAQPTLKSHMPQGVLKAQVTPPPMFTNNGRPNSVFTINGRPYSLLQTGQGVTANPQHELLSAQPALKSNMPQGILKAQIKPTSVFTFNGKPYSLQSVTANPQHELLSAQSSHKFPFVKIPRPTPLLCKKLKERQMHNKMQKCEANVNMDTQTNENKVLYAAM